MSKKSFRGGFDGLISNTEYAKETRHEPTNLLKNEKRATFIMQSEHLEKIKAISYWERKMIKDVLSDALEQYLANYEKVKGKILLPSSKQST